MITLFKLKGVPNNFTSLPFGRRMEYHRTIETFKQSAKRSHVSQKRVPYRKAIKEFIKLNDVDEYYCSFHSELEYFDDTFEFFYRSKVE